jgi:hypothetical protein
LLWCGSSLKRAPIVCVGFLIEFDATRVQIARAVDAATAIRGDLAQATRR